MSTQTLVGPFRQLLSLSELSLKGPVTDYQLQVLQEGGILLEGAYIKAIGHFESLRKQYHEALLQEIAEDLVLLPGFIDCHTHICFGGSRARDYALRIAGTTYQEILEKGGGIHDSVAKTRETGLEALAAATAARANRHLHEGVTTIEVKSGYGLSVAEEIKMLQAIRLAEGQTTATLVATCLAAHVTPKEFNSPEDWLEQIVQELLPQLREVGLARRVDIFIEDEAFPASMALRYLRKAKMMGFDICVHADQFSTQGVPVAVHIGAHSADHLENSSEANLLQLAASDTVGVALPGASLGLGMAFAPARKLLNAGACLAIATDWNPGSAPMGDLLTQASILGAAEKLSTAETFAAITYRAAHALRIQDRGRLKAGMLADMVAFPTADYREILYHQGKLKPGMVWKAGKGMRVTN